MPDMRAAKWLVAVLTSGALVSGLTACQPAEAPAAGWRITTYYTPVEQFFGGEPVAVRGYPALEADTQVDLGSYPSGFVDAVHEEGGGRISTGEHAGHYLNWSWDTGYWLDTSTRDSAGDPLVPFETAALDDVQRGTTLKIVDCGKDDDGTPVEASACEQLRAADWVVRDEFTPGFGGERHVDLYLGEQDRADFTESPLWVSWSDAQVTLEP